MSNLTTPLTALSEPMKHDGWISAAQFSPDGQRVVTASVIRRRAAFEIDSAAAIDEVERFEAAAPNHLSLV